MLSQNEKHGLRRLDSENVEACGDKDFVKSSSPKPSLRPFFSSNASKNSIGHSSHDGDVSALTLDLIALSNYGSVCAHAASILRVV